MSSTDAAEVDTFGSSDHDGHHDSGSFGTDEVHEGLSDKQYVVVALILAVITAAEVSLTYIDMPHWLFMTGLLALMAIKFFTVILYFMHLKFDNSLFGTLFYMGLGLALFVYIGTLLMFHFFV